jgi:RNA polymerase sigma-70 factor (ECF subfamily)
MAAGEGAALKLRAEVVDLTSVETMEAFVTRVLPGAYRLATIMLRDPVSAEDVAHDAVVAAWEHRSRLRDPDAADAWFARIVANKCRDRLRDRSRHPVVELTPESVSIAPDSFRHLDDRDELGRAIDALTPDEQIVLGLRFGRDLQIAEIARRLGQPEGTIKSRLHLARMRLRAALTASRTRQEEHR